MTHKWYYDLTPDHRYSEDPESLLVWLCEDCSTRLETADVVQLAGTDSLCDVPCWLCGQPVAHTQADQP